MVIGFKLTPAQSGLKNDTCRPWTFSKRDYLGKYWDSRPHLDTIVGTRGRLFMDYASDKRSPGL